MSLTGHWLISAGELSGDILAADLVKDLKKAHPSLHFSGITGPHLRSEGVVSLASIEDLNMMGLAEIFKRLPYIVELKREILGFVDRNQIRVVILVDFAGFHLKLAEELKMRGVYVIQYVAPKLWAWGERRVDKLRQCVDLVLATFPFEEEYFRSRNVNCYYIGCPITKRIQTISKDKNTLGFQSKKLVALLPGSRRQEVERLLPHLFSIARKIHEYAPEIEFLIPIAESLKNKAHLFPFQKEDYLHYVVGKSLEVMAISDAAVVGSGTATLECALVETPLTVIYSMNPMTYAIAKRKVRVLWASLVNILSSKLVVKEFLQNIDHTAVAQEIVDLVENEARRSEMLESFIQLKESLEKVTDISAVERIEQALKKIYGSK